MALLQPCGKTIIIDGMTLAPPTGKSMVHFLSDGTAVVSNENGEVIHCGDLDSALVQVGWHRRKPKAAAV